MNFRRELKDTDAGFIKEILESTGFFYDYEIDIALELVEENLAKGEEKSGYIFYIAETYKIPVGFACFGKTPCTASSFDLYWIAVHQEQKGQGIGKLLLNTVENEIAKLGGKNIWVETSSRPLYEPTRMFYLKTGYKMVSELQDFYGENDNKNIFQKKI